MADGSNRHAPPRGIDQCKGRNDRRRCRRDTLDSSCTSGGQTPHRVGGAGSSPLREPPGVRYRSLPHDRIQPARCSRHEINRELVSSGQERLTSLLRCRRFKEEWYMQRKFSVKCFALPAVAGLAASLLLVPALMAATAGKPTHL